MNNQPWPEGYPFCVCPKGHALSHYSEIVDDRIYGTCEECGAPFCFALHWKAPPEPWLPLVATLESVPLPIPPHDVPINFDPFVAPTPFPTPARSRLAEAFQKGLVDPTTLTHLRSETFSHGGPIYPTHPEIPSDSQHINIEVKNIMQEMSEQVIRELLSDGVEMGNALRIFNRRLHAVGAGLLRGPHHTWTLLKQAPAMQKENSETFDTFAQAFDAALGLLTQRSGSVNSTVTKADDVFKMMGGESK